jgi:hypothetical protein
MTVTYPDDAAKTFGRGIETSHADAVRDEPFVPRYARPKAARRGKIRTWMILVPVGAVVLGGIAAIMLMDGEAAAPLAEPAATAPVLPATAPTTDTAITALESAATPVPVAAAPAPVVPALAPTRSTAPAAAPVRRVAPRAETPAPRVTTPTPAASAQPVGPQPYARAPAGPTSSLNTAPTTPTPTPVAPTPAPVIVIAPQG